MKIALITPARPGSHSGNRNTATRWARLLRAGGHTVTVEQEWSGAAADLMLALHARKSYPSAARFAARYPERPLVVVLTGTDLYRDIQSDADAQAALELATRLVLLQPQGIKELAPALRHKARVVYQSAKPLMPVPGNARFFEVSVIGHLRDEKDPLRTARALALLPGESRIRVTQLGAALSPEMEQEAAALMQREPRYRWLGDVPHWKVRHYLARSRLMVISSRMEGGANVVAEAVMAGVPVLASRISGNVGMLGPDYAGYYPLGDEHALAKLLWRAEHDAAFYLQLLAQCRARQPLFGEERERQSLEAVLQDHPGSAAMNDMPDRNAISAHYRWVDLAPDLGDFWQEVRAGLSLPRKQLAPKYFYDEAGSALYEQICATPEYYPTRTETAILIRQIGAIAARVGAGALLIEFGSGSSRKTRILLDHIGAAGYLPIDLSCDALAYAAAGLAADYPKLEIVAVCADYSRPLSLPPLGTLEGLRRVVFFPGSTIGNLQPEEAQDFLANVRGLIGPDGALLIGVDLKKDKARLDAAYDDAAGVTRDFNLNLLARINRELGADFDLSRFRHHAFYNEALGRIEMHLVSTCAQTVTIHGETFHFAEGETLHTENSYKYTVEEFQALAARAGLAADAVWTDEERLFSVHYLVAA
jgi:dimethylhistidine N-methyltransferase